MSDNKKEERASIEALKFYVAYYKDAIVAQEKLLESKRIGPHERNLLETQSQLRNIVTRKIFAIFGPLITNEIKASLSSSTMAMSTDVWASLQTAALEGMDRGLRKIDLEKTISPTNYLMMWVSAYVTRERDRLEMPVDMSVNLYRKFKKISAVRKKMKDDLDREPTDEEVLKYFHEGKADVKSMKGKKTDGGYQKSNQTLKLSDIAEQAKFESSAMSMKVLDTTDEMSVPSFSGVDGPTSKETVFGSFCEKYGITEKAKTVIYSELGIEIENYKILEDMPKKEYNKLLRLWRILMKDPSGVFLEYLLLIKNDGFEEFDVLQTIKAIQASPSNNQDYSELFEEKK